MMKKHCTFFQKGTCRKGINCEFIHETQQQQTGGMLKTGSFKILTIYKILPIFR
jgi:hypothetical protein